jgi:hypothetical protein
MSATRKLAGAPKGTLQIELLVSYSLPAGQERRECQSPESSIVDSGNNHFVDTLAGQVIPSRRFAPEGRISGLVIEDKATSAKEVS